MKAKASNIRVKLKDVKQGRTFYTAHPVYGIREWSPTSKPFLKLGSWWVKTGSGLLETESLRDNGVYNPYNGRRTFFTRRHAEQWVEGWGNDPRFIAHQKKHEKFCKTLEFTWDFYDDY